MGNTEQTMWTLSLTALLACCLTCLAAEVTPGASLYGQRQQYAQAYPYSTKDEDKTSLSNMMYALSPVLLPPSNTAEETDEAAKYYNSYYSNTEENADLFYKKASPESDPWLTYYDSLPTHVGQYQGPLVDELPKHAGQYQGPQVDELPQHAGQYQGPDQNFEEVDPQENMIFDVPRIFLKGFD